MRLDHFEKPVARSDDALSNGLFMTVPECLAHCVEIAYNIFSKRSLASFNCFASLVFRVSLIALVFTATACVPVTQDLEQEIAKVKAKKGAPVEPLPPMKDYEPYPYTALNLRDPFAPFANDVNSDTDAVNSSGISPDATRVKESLEGFPLDALDMVGTMGEVPNIVALIKDPDGVVHRVSVDNYMGQNEGRVTVIFEDHVDLVELIPNGTGGWMERPASIALDEG